MITRNVSRRRTWNHENKKNKHKKEHEKNNKQMENKAANENKTSMKHKKKIHIGTVIAKRNRKNKNL
jgi:hypothetical protein